MKNHIQPESSASSSRLGQSGALILWSIQSLGPQQAYGAAIQRHIAAVAGKQMALGQIYTTLERLEAKELLNSTLSKPEPVRGGRAKRMFQLTERGVQALEAATALYATVSVSIDETNNGREGKSFA